MTPDMAFECLLVCRDAGALRTVNRTLQNLSVCTSICLNPSRAFKALTESEADLVVVDWEGEPSAQLVREIWQWPKWKKPTIVALATHEDSIPGVHIVLRKPVTEESVTLSLKAAYSRMLHDHRRYARHSLGMSVIATDDNDRSFVITLNNIGQGGVGFNSQEDLMIGQELSFRLLLPGEKRDIFIQARVLWTRESGAAGCEFMQIPPVDLDVLHDWLKRKTLVKQPLIPLCENDTSLATGQVE